MLAFLASTGLLGFDLATKWYPDVDESRREGLERDLASANELRYELSKGGGCAFPVCVKVVAAPKLTRPGWSSEEDPG